MNEKQLTFEGVMRIVQGNKWIQLKDIERLEKFIQNQQATIQSLKEENEQLRKQIQNYEQLISNSYVGEEETLDGFVGKYVIWENELQKYKNKK